MFWITIVLFAVAACADSFVIGFNYGVKGVRISTIANSFLSLICLVGTFLSMLLGRFSGYYLDPAATDAIGGLIFVLLGLWMLKGSLSAPKLQQRTREYSENPELVDKDQSSVIELRESLLIGLILCLNNIGLGIGAGMAHISMIMAPLVSALFSFVFIWSGCAIGKRITSRLFSRVLEIVGAMLIVVLGIKELTAFLFKNVVG